jgi:hypothetical protein
MKGWYFIIHFSNLLLLHGAKVVRGKAITGGGANCIVAECYKRLCVAAEVHIRTIALWAFPSFFAGQSATGQLFGLFAGQSLPFRTDGLNHGVACFCTSKSSKNFGE